MPVEHLSYRPPFWLRNPHLHTVLASFRKVRHLKHSPVEEVLPTPDGDELYIDWYRSGAKRLLIISHGLEGNSRRPYVLGMTAAALSAGWDVLAWNYRSCAGVPNKKLQNYHSGSTQDLDLLVREAVSRGYDQIALCGFSIGGNKTLLYVSREKHLVPKEVTAALAFSVPCDLVNSSKVLAKKRNRIYMNNFLSTLEEKLQQKQQLYPEKISLEGFKRIKTFAQFDERYTAPLNGFDSALDYWLKSSSLPHLESIEIPTALITSLDDPFLSSSCYPVEVAKRNANFHLKLTRYGGHVGYMTGKQTYFSESEGLAFINAI